MRSRAWIWSTDETPHSGSGRRVVYVEHERRPRAGDRYRVRARPDQQRPDVLSERQWRAVLVEPVS